MDEPTKSILRQLLAEFRERNLTSTDLRRGYIGLTSIELKNRCADEKICEVDYDLAFNELVSKTLIHTGPMVPYENPPYSRVVMVGLYSKREYVYLTERGYKEAIKMASTAPSRLKPSKSSIHIKGGTFHNSPIGVGENVTQTVNVSTAGSDEMFAQLREEVARLVSDDTKRNDILAKVDELEVAYGEPSRFAKYTNLVAVIGDHITVLGFLLPPVLQWIKG